MAQRYQAENTMRSFREVLSRHKKKIVVCPLLAIALGAAVLLLFPRTYRSEAQLLVRIGRESVGIDPTATTGQTVPLQQTGRKDEIRSAIQVLKSREITSKVVDRLGSEVVLCEGGLGAKKSNRIAELVSKPVHWAVGVLQSIDPISQRKQASVEVKDNLRVAAERESMLIVVQYDAKSPKLAQTICEAIIDVYQQEHMRIHRSQGSQPFFAEQQMRLQTELDQSLEELREAKSEIGLASAEARRATLESQFSAIELERLATQQQLATAKAHAAELEAQLGKTPERLVDSQRSVPNVGADLLREQLYALEVKSMDLQARYSESHPLVAAVNDQLRDAKKVLAEQAEQRTETTDNINPIHRQLSLELKQEQGALAGLKAREAELAKQKAAVVADLRSLNAAELKLDQLERTAELARDKYRQYSKSIEESRIDAELEINNLNNLSIVQPATYAERPVSPSKLIVLMATFVLATAGTAALILGSEQFDHRSSYHSDTDNNLGVSALASIPGDGAQGHMPKWENGKTRVPSKT